MPTHSDLVREAVAAFNRRDFEALPRLFAADLEYRESIEWPQAGVYRGLEAFAAYFARLTATVDDLQGEVLETVEEGGRVLALLRTWGRDKETGKPVELTFTGLYTFSDGKCVLLQGFLNRELAMRELRGEPAARQPHSG